MVGLGPRFAIERAEIGNSRPTVVRACALLDCHVPSGHHEPCKYGNLQGSLCVTYNSQPVHGQRDGTNTWPRTKNDRNGREPCVVSSADWRGRAAAQCLSW